MRYPPQNRGILCVLQSQLLPSKMADTTTVPESEGEPTYGGCEGPDAMYVKLISSDGHEFIIKRDHALTSGTIKAMLSGPGMASLRFQHIAINVNRSTTPL